MNKTLAALVVSSFCLVFAGAASAASATPDLAQRHAQMNIKFPAAGVKVNNDYCFKCHGSYETLAKRTEKLDPNPHRTHLGNVRCTDCHSLHGAPRNMCNDCHKFDLQPK